MGFSLQTPEESPRILQVPLEALQPLSWVPQEGHACLRSHHRA